MGMWSTEGDQRAFEHHGKFPTVATARKVKRLKKKRRYGTEPRFFLKESIVFLCTALPNRVSERLRRDSRALGVRTFGPQIISEFSLVAHQTVADRGLQSTPIE